MRYQRGRREFLKRLGILASAVSLRGGPGEARAAAPQPGEAAKPAEAATANPAAARGAKRAGGPAPVNVHSLSGIDPKAVVGAYADRRLDELSDADLYRATSGIVSVPCKGLTSFTLHAPLEQMARYALLRHVDPADKPLARLQMVASAAAYEAGTKPLAAPPRSSAFANAADGRGEIARALADKDPDRMEAASLQMAAQFGTPRLVHLLVPIALPTLTAATHAHIGLWLLLRHGSLQDVGDASPLRAVLRMMAEEPTARLRSFSGMSMSGAERLAKSTAEVQAEVLRKLANPKKGKVKGYSIRSLLEAGEATGNANALFGETIRGNLSPVQIDAAFRAILRASAHGMLQDDPAQAKFGWTHCLTLPQAAFGLASLDASRRLALAAAFVWISAYRSVLSKRALDFGWAPEDPGSSSLGKALHSAPAVAGARVWHAPDEELPAVRLALATEASIRNDQHLVKYVRACFDLGSLDPEATRLYLSSAAYLCALWIAEAPRDGIAGHLLDGRATPE